MSENILDIVQDAKMILNEMQLNDKKHKNKINVIINKLEREAKKLQKSNAILNELIDIYQNDQLSCLKEEI